MANIFRITNGQKYIAKTGAAGNAGTAEAPQALSNGAAYANQGGIIWGAGSYIWPSATASGSAAIHQADGLVRFLGDTNTIQQAFAGNSSSWDGFYFEQFAGMTFGDNAGASRCIFDILAYSAGNSLLRSGGTYSNCIFLSWCPVTVAGNGAPTFNNCLFINCLVNFSNSGGGCVFNNCYLDATTGLNLSTGSTLVNCNIDPALVVATNKGVKIGAGAWGNGQGQAGCTACISQAPQFNAIGKGDYTLKSTSPHLTYSIGPTQWGRGVNALISTTAATAADMSTANTSMVSSSNSVANNLLSIAGDGFTANSAGGAVVKTITGGTFASTLTSGLITVDPDRALEIGIANFLGGLNFNTDFQATDTTAPNLRNSNVPDFDNGSTAAGTRKPNHLSFRIRWSILANPDVNTPGHWESGSTFVEMIYGVKMAYNVAGYVGNASASFVPGNAVPVLARTIQLELTQRNNYGA